MTVSTALLLCLCLAAAVPLAFGYTYLPTDLLSLTLPWKAGVAQGFQNHFYMDVMGEHFVWKIFLHRQLQEGIFPLWNPYNYCGTPFLALSTPQLLDPFNVLYGMLEPRWAFDLILLGKIFFSGYFMSCLLRHYRLRGAAGAVGAIAYALNGCYIYYLHYGWMLGAFVWAPLVILFLERAVMDRPARNAAWAALFLGIAILSAGVQVTIYLLLLVGFWCLARMWIGDGVAKRWRRVALCGAATVAGAMAVSAINTLPTAELLAFGFSRRDAFSTAMWLGNLEGNLLRLPFLLAFMLPHFFGHHAIFSPVLFTGGQWDDFMKGYVGLVPILLAGFAVWTIKQGLVRRYACIAAATLTLLFFTPAVEWLYFRALIVWCFAVAVLAAIGAAALVQADRRALAKARRLCGWSFVILAVGLWCMHFFVRLFKGDLIRFWGEVVQGKVIYSPYVSLKAFYLDKVSRTFEYYAFDNPGLLMTFAVLLAVYLALRWHLKKRLTGAALARIALVLTVADLLYFASQYAPLVDLGRYPPYPITPSVEFLRGMPVAYRAMAIAQRNVDDPIFYHESNMAAAIPMVHHTGSINYLPAERFFQALQRPADGLPFNPRLANLASVKYLMTKSIALDPARYPLAHRSEVDIYENPRALPRAFFPRSVEAASDNAMFAALSDPAFDPAERTLIERLPPTLPDGKSGDGRATIAAQQSDRVAIDVEASGPRVLVLTDTYYPGWRATVDGHATPIYRANYVFRAVAVPAGRHHIVFRYCPASFYWGAGVSGLALIGILGVGCRPRRTVG
ncbi:MAG: YfhO family protein [Deltaproteobacteria bacterium]|nr:YfhO family protein [Deltaproteobacteria bacterium]